MRGMDLVVRGRSQDQHGVRPWDTGRTREEPGKTEPEGVGGPEWSQAGQEQRGPKSRKQQLQQSQVYTRGSQRHRAG